MPYSVIIIWRLLFVDIDECFEGVDMCGQICNNTIGSYVCHCHIGYRLNMDNLTCSGMYA